MADWNSHHTRIELNLLKRVFDEASRERDLDSVLALIACEIRDREEKLQ